MNANVGRNAGDFAPDEGDKRTVIGNCQDCDGNSFRAPVLQVYEYVEIDDVHERLMWVTVGIAA